MVSSKVERGDMVGVQAVEDDFGTHAAAAADLKRILPR